MHNYVIHFLLPKDILLMYSNQEADDGGVDSFMKMFWQRLNCSQSPLIFLVAYNNFNDSPLARVISREWL